MNRAALIALFVAGAALAAAEVDVSNKPGPESETDVAIDPNNGQHVVGGSNNINATKPTQVFYESNDRGATWALSYLPLPTGAAFESDPAVVFDRSSDIYYAFVASDNANNLSLWVAKKPAGVTTWLAPVNVPAVNSDKEFVTADRDPSSPCVDSVYVAWDNNEATGNQTIRVSRSSNGGQSFANPSQVNAGGQINIGAYPVVGLGGELYVSWGSFDNKQIHIAHSTDCGATWSGESTVVTFTLPLQGITYGANGQLISDPQRGISAMPAMAVDTSSGPHRGRVYVVYNDLSASGQDVDVFVTSSDDQGATWSTPYRLNDDAPSATNDQYMPRVSVDPSDGSVHVAFYDTRNDSTRHKADVYLASSFDGTTWVPNQRITTQMSDETQPTADPNGYGDYLGIAALNGMVEPLWTEDPTGANEDIYAITLADKLSIASTALTPGQVGMPYTQSLQAFGGKPPYTWSVTGLPSSLSYDANTGAITGTPVQGDLGSHPLSVTLTDATAATASGTVQFQVIWPPPVIGTTSLPDATAATAYSVTLQASGGLPPYTWSATGLPASLTVSSSGTISGTPSNPEANTYAVTITVTDSRSGTAQAQLPLVVHTTPLDVAPATLPTGQEGVVYAGYTFQVSGGTPPYYWQFQGGSPTPPNGIFLTANGTLEGTPAAGSMGSYDLQISVADSSSPLQTGSIAATLVIYGPQVVKAVASVAATTVDPGPVTLDGSQSTSEPSVPLTYQWSGPTNVTIANPTAVTTTTSPLTEAKTYPFTLVVSGGGATSQPSTVNVTVRNVAPVVKLAAPNKVPVGSTVTLDATGTSDANGDTLTYTWSETGGPSGFTLASQPTATFVAAKAGTYQVHLQVSDGTHSVGADATIIAVAGGCGCGAADTARGDLLIGAFALLGLIATRRRFAV